MALIKVYRKDTGEIVRVPEHFMSNPSLSKPFSKTPSQRAREAKTSASRAGEATTPELTNPKE